MAAPPYLLLPEKIDDKLFELAKEQSKTRFKELHHNFRIIYSTIYYKFTSEDGGKLFNQFYSAYWRKIFGGHYRDYLKPLLDAHIIEKDENYYAINAQTLLRLRGRVRAVDVERKVDTSSPLYKKTQHAYETLEFDYDTFLNDLRHNNISQQTYELVDLNLLPEELKLKVKYLGSSDKDYGSSGSKLREMVTEKGVHTSSVLYHKGYLHLYPVKDFMYNKVSSLEENALVMNHFLKTKSRTYCSLDSEKTGRIFTSISGITSLALPYISIDDEPLVGLDFKSSQFAILANILYQLNQGNAVEKSFKKQRGNKEFIKELKQLLRNKTSDSSDIIKFYQDILNGDFYNKIGDLIGTKYRFLTKQLAFEFVFSKPSKTKTLFESKIEELYPTVYSIIRDYKKAKMSIDPKEGYKQFSIMLQSLESEILLDHIYPAVTKHNRIKALTKHDSIIVKESQAQEARNIMVQKLKMMKLNINIEEEHYKKKEANNQFINNLNNEEYETLLTTWSESRHIENIDLDILLSLIEEDPDDLHSNDDNKEELIIRLQHNNKHQIPLSTEDINSLTIQLDYYLSLLNS